MFLQSESYEPINYWPSYLINAATAARKKTFMNINVINKTIKQIPIVFHCHCSRPSLQMEWNVMNWINSVKKDFLRAWKAHYKLNVNASTIPCTQHSSENNCNVVEMLWAQARTMQNKKIMGTK